MDEMKSINFLQIFQVWIQKRQGEKTEQMTIIKSSNQIRSSRRLHFYDLPDSVRRKTIKLYFISFISNSKLSI